MPGLKKGRFTSFLALQTRQQMKAPSTSWRTAEIQKKIAKSSWWQVIFWRLVFEKRAT